MVALTIPGNAAILVVRQDQASLLCCRFGETRYILYVLAGM